MEAAIESEWGTTAWHDKQTANTARFGYVLMPPVGALTGKAEIRRITTPKGVQSASTDHLPADSQIWLK